MSVALKCDLCKKFFQIGSDDIPNILTFAKLTTSDNADLIYDNKYVSNKKIIKNECSRNNGAHIFNMCEQCYKKIENLIIDDGETDESFIRRG